MKLLPMARLQALRVAREPSEPSVVSVVSVASAGATALRVGRARMPRKRRLLRRVIATSARCSLPMVQPLLRAMLAKLRCKAKPAPAAAATASAATAVAAHRVKMRTVPQPTAGKQLRKLSNLPM